MPPETQTQELELDITHYLNLVSRRRWILISCWASVFLIVALATFNMRPIYTAQSLLIIEKERGGGGGRMVSDNESLVERNNEDYYQTQYQLLKSQTLLRKVSTKLNLPRLDDFYGRNAVAKLTGAVTIAPIPRSRLVYIKVETHDPSLSASISNTLAKAYIEQNLSNQLFISQDVLRALQSKQSDTQSRALFDSLPAVVNNPLMQQLKQEAARLQAQMSEFSERYTPRHPQVTSLKARLDTLKSQMTTETDRIVQSLKIDLSGQLMGNNIRLIDPALPPERPSKPKKRLNLLIGLLGGFVAGFLAASLADVIDQTVRTQEDAENKLGLPFLGFVPMTVLDKKDPVYQPMFSKEQSLTSESVRNLRTMIDFAEISQKHKSFLVTSSMQGEGKSYVCANLAVALSQMGDKVLLIDGDMRRSNLHKLFRLSNEKGLSDFLAKSQGVSELEGLMQQTSSDRLSVLVCGSRPPNPAELLNTPRLAALIAWAQEHYDRVVVDCPPMFPISDTLLWAKHIPACMFIVKYGKTRVPLIKAATKRLLNADVKILGAAVNMARFGGLSYSYYGHYYHNYNYYHYYHDETGESEKREPQLKT